MKKVLCLLTIGIGLLGLQGCVSNAPTMNQAAAEINVALGINNLINKEMPEAKEHMRRAMELAPDLPKTQLGMGMYFQALGDKEQSEHYYQLAIHNKDEEVSTIARAQYAIFLFDCKRFSESDKHFQLALQSEHFPAEVRRMAAVCAWFKHDYVKAKKYFKESLEYDPNVDDVWLALAEVYYETGDYHAAQDSLQRYNRRGKPCSMSRRLASDLKGKMA